MDILVLIDRIIYLILKEEKIQKSSSVTYKKDVLNDIENSLTVLSRTFNSKLSELSVDSIRSFKQRLEFKMHVLSNSIAAKSKDSLREGLSVDDLRLFMEYYKYYRQEFDAKISEIKCY